MPILKDIKRFLNYRTDWLDTIASHNTEESKINFKHKERLNLNGFVATTPQCGRSPENQRSAQTKIMRKLPARGARHNQL